MKCFLIVNLLVWIQDVSYCDNHEDHVVYARLGEKTILPFEISLVTNVIWKRDEYFISEGFTINKSFNGNERFRVVGDQTKGEYNLEISNIAESDFGLYLCEFQAKNNALQKKVVLKLADNKSTVAKDVYREQSTFKDDASKTYVSVTSKTNNADPTTLLNDISTQSKQGLHSEISAGIPVHPVLIYVIVCISCICFLCLLQTARYTFYKCKHS